MTLLFYFVPRIQILSVNILNFNIHQKIIKKIPLRANTLNLFVLFYNVLKEKMLRSEMKMKMGTKSHKILVHFLLELIVKDKKNRRFITKISKFSKYKFLKIRSFINLPWGPLGPTKKLCPIGPAVFTFIGYNRTDLSRQTSKVYM